MARYVYSGCQYIMPGVEIHFTDGLREYRPNKKETKMKDEKILIMCDKKNPKRVIARDISAGKEAEAICCDSDEFDFNTGAKLAFRRLMKNVKSEKKKPWTGKVFCTCDIPGIYTKGRIYEIVDGVPYVDVYLFSPFHDNEKFRPFTDDKSIIKKITDYKSFIKAIDSYNFGGYYGKPLEEVLVEVKED